MVRSQDLHRKFNTVIKDKKKLMVKAIAIRMIGDCELQYNLVRLYDPTAYFLFLTSGLVYMVVFMT